MGAGTSRRKRSGNRILKVGIKLFRPPKNNFGGIGVTCLGGRFFLHEFPFEIQASSAHSSFYDYTQCISLDDEMVRVTLTDGTEPLYSETSRYIHHLLTGKAQMDDDVTGAAFCYDVTRHGTWEDLKCLIEEVLLFGLPSKKKIMIVACKCDFVEEREVDFKTVQEFANENEILYIETSAKENLNVEYAFFSFAAQLLAID